MSRSDRTNEFLQNPATRFFEWSGSEGKLKWREKVGEEYVTHFIDPPFRFLVLDQLNTVVGWSDETASGFYATEVRHNDDSIALRSKRHIVATAPWKELKKILGTQFAKSVYIAFYNDSEELSIGHLKLSGSALGGVTDGEIARNLAAHKKDLKVSMYSDDVLRRVGWFNFTKTCPDILDIAVEWSGSIQDKTGATDYIRPIFSRIETVSEETSVSALELDVQLQEYLRTYLAQGGRYRDEPAGKTEDHVENYIDERNKEIASYNDELPAHIAEKHEAAAAQSGRTPAQDKALAAVRPKPVNDDDIPF